MFANLGRVEYGWSLMRAKSLLDQFVRLIFAIGKSVQSVLFAHNNTYSSSFVSRATTLRLEKKQQFFNCEIIATSFSLPVPVFFLQFT